MDPEFGIGLGSDAGAERPAPPRPSLLIRAMEVAGLALLVLGLGGWQLWQIALGGGMVIGSYAIYRWQHGPQAGPAAGSDRPDGGDGGGE